TEARVVLYAPDEALGRKAADAAFDRIAALDRVMSDWKEDSELSALCRGSGGPGRAVSADLFVVLERALEIAEASGGAFDPTVGPIVQLWRKARREHAMPDPAALEEARSRVGWRLVRLWRGMGIVELTKPGMRL